jgi:Zn-dependent protease with chaperone function
LTGDTQVAERQVSFMKQKLEELAQKAGLRRAPDLSISKTERLASVNVFQKRISVGTNVLSLWEQGKFSDQDIEATLAHEVGHLMDFRRESKSKNFRNLLIESFWFSFGVVPFVSFVFSPSLLWMVVSAVLAVTWAFSLPIVVRRVEVRIELEADRNAGVYLVAPQQLADALVKISSFGMPAKTVGFTAKMAFLAGTLTHPTFKDRVRFLQTLQFRASNAVAVQV